MHGVVFAFFVRLPLPLPENQPRAMSMPRCSEAVFVAAFAFGEIPPQFLLSATAVHAARFSPLADVLTFLRLSPRQAPNFASRLAKQNNVQP
ncbi:bsl0592 [Bradyrhizobium diazoefficiens USDA 110]|uniref:Bsl0592 protein n=1 Tax=Bradyrhizobium diazoefficiens (strain JCM 10833 / BCRC 13528 / IAM 13628 / NBRC 14792 / USDA 110) TaxID=224911 RepID=Q89WT6_BRADU|nr:hypothetical protein CO678_08840 [Bradyrhizobium diazoefficiens]QBP19551.1 hypothetical protein Bdiaspc4_02690 [Bradyrhizobium diazoefficiens]BAC45857.1 bsl0592 [Bradyrhizobium diazoefficiens USDA 110]